MAQSQSQSVSGSDGDSTNANDSIGSKCDSCGAAGDLIRNKYGILCHDCRHGWMEEYVDVGENPHQERSQSEPDAESDTFDDGFSLSASGPVVVRRTDGGVTTTRQEEMELAFNLVSKDTFDTLWSIRSGHEYPMQTHEKSATVTAVLEDCDADTSNYYPTHIDEWSITLDGPINVYTEACEHVGDYKGASPSPQFMFLQDASGYWLFGDSGHTAFVAQAESDGMMDDTTVQNRLRELVDDV